MLFNASPDILQQIKATPALQPGRAVRDTAIADVVLVDGQVDHATGLPMLRVDTFWTDDEMIALGLSTKTARDIGHLPQHGPGGMLEWLDRLPARTRRLLVHVNNTNPILDEHSPQRAELARHRVEVCADGQLITP